MWVIMRNQTNLVFGKKLENLRHYDFNLFENSCYIFFYWTKFWMKSHDLFFSYFKKHFSYFVWRKFATGSWIRWSHGQIFFLFHCFSLNFFFITTWLSWIGGDVIWQIFACSFQCHQQNENPLVTFFYEFLKSLY